MEKNLMLHKILKNNRLEDFANDNLTQKKYSIRLFSALALLLLLFLWIISREGDFTEVYVMMQKDSFFFLNAKLSAYPDLQRNLTALGDVVIVFPLLLIFMFRIPKLWEALLTSSLLSLGLTAGLKKTFSVPRPARMFPHESFSILGRTLSGMNSLPSGHTITIFIVITIVLFAFMPKNKGLKIFWTLGILGFGAAVGLSRGGVGAHYPCDVLIGSVIGCLLGISGIMLNAKIKWLTWAKQPSFYPIFMVIILIWIIVLVSRILADNLPVIYVSTASLMITLFLITKSYVQSKITLPGTDNECV